MKKNISKMIVIAVVAICAGIGVYQAQQTNIKMSDLALSNIEALANNDEIDPNKAYGYQLKNCCNEKGQITGARCVSVQDREASCQYSSAWGDC